jgi:hypothetical protein
LEQWWHLVAVPATPAGSGMGLKAYFAANLKMEVIDELESDLDK